MHKGCAMMKNNAGGWQGICFCTLQAILTRGMSIVINLRKKLQSGANKV